jgi:hypothetical protein
VYMTGENGLGRKDFSIMETGLLKILPKDEQGCSVLWLDGSRLQKGHVAQSRDW